MNFTFVVAFLAAALAVGAAPIGETNAQRLARGLPPLAPSNLKRGSPVAGNGFLAALLSTNTTDKQPSLAAKRGKPSGN